ncbi:MAG: hypothetical protein Salg2KO_18890 [Salibacteraceae bacterium]
MPIPSKKIPLLEAIPKIRSYCNYRERCHKEVREKLYGMGLWKRDVDQAIMQMMDENLLNEERYAKAYARGHFYHKDWGKYKITIELRKKQIHERLITAALKEIEEDDYQNTIDRLVSKKWKEYDGSKFEKRQKVNNFLVGKGYRYDEISFAIAKKMK